MLNSIKNRLLAVSYGYLSSIISYVYCVKSSVSLSFFTLLFVVWFDVDDVDVVDVPFSLFSRMICLQAKIIHFINC